jgi:sigma-E factor negative regulatory protein RseA
VVVASQVEASMSDRSDGNGGAQINQRQELSAVLDGELSGDDLRRLCASWRNDPEVRETWHAFSLIGDVMRSEDLASPASRDERFLVDLRARLADEPVVLAPAAPLTPQAGPLDADALLRVGQRASKRSWWAPAAVAAGFVAVVGTLVVVSQAPQRAAAESVQLAVATPTASAVQAPSAVVVARAENPASFPESVATGELIRDPQLDQYLLAHKQLAGSSVLGAPSGFLRNAAVEVPAR